MKHHQRMTLLNIKLFSVLASVHPIQNPPTGQVYSRPTKLSENRTHCALQEAAHEDAAGVLGAVSHLLLPHFKQFS